MSSDRRLARTMGQKKDNFLLNRRAVDVPRNCVPKPEILDHRRIYTLLEDITGPEWPSYIRIIPPPDRPIISTTH